MPCSGSGDRVHRAPFRRESRRVRARIPAPSGGRHPLRHFPVEGQTHSIPGEGASSVIPVMALATGRADDQCPRCLNPSAP